jgi:hypothetical protein
MEREPRAWLDLTGRTGVRANGSWLKTYLVYCHPRF